jgi:DNA-binding SARP family transcriptional activator
MPDRSTKVARMQFLGALRVEMGSAVVTPEAERLFAMLVRLSVPLGRIVGRQTIMDTIWPGVDDANARHNLRQTIYKAREVGLVIDSSEDGLRLDPRYWSCDWEDPTGDVPGEWLARYDPAFSPALEAWVTSRRGGVHAQLRPRMVRSLQAARAGGDYRNANKYALELLAIDELNEEATLTRAEVLVMQGAKAEALRLLDVYLAELGRLSAGEDAALPAKLLRKRITEKLPIIEYHRAEKHLGPLVGRADELQQLLGGLFEARAGRGGAVLIQGADGMGKSRLLYELRKAALLQDVTVLELTCDTSLAVMPFATMRALVRRLLDYPGAIGVSPEALAALRKWLTSQTYAPDDCPVAEIEDLLAAVSEEKPLILQIEDAHRIDAETLNRLDRIYRRGQTRCHMAVLTSATAATPTERPVELTWIDRLPLRPLLAVEVRGIIEAVAKTMQPRATAEQITFASVFAEGVPMYGIEMLGLMLDEGSPDVIPFRVQVAVDRVLRELSELQWRILALAWLLGENSLEEAIVAGVQSPSSELEAAFDELEVRGYLVNVEGTWNVSPLLAVEAMQRLRATTRRRDAQRAASVFLRIWHESAATSALLTTLRLNVIAGREAFALRLLDREAGPLIRRATSETLLFSISELLKEAKMPELRASLEHLQQRIASASGFAFVTSTDSVNSATMSSLPKTSWTTVEQIAENPLVSTFEETLLRARRSAAPSAERFADAVMALVISHNIGSDEKIRLAIDAIDAVRHAPNLSPFDIARADCIAASVLGNRPAAILCAQRLAAESRRVNDIQLACMGLRNSSDSLIGYGELSQAQSFLHEAREIAANLGYPAQLATIYNSLGDLSVDMMDPDGAIHYSHSAEELAIQHRIKSALLWTEIYFVRAWAYLLKGAMVDAGKCAKLAKRKLTPASPQRSQSAIRSIRLASHSGAFSHEIERETRLLHDEVGTRAFSINEERSLAALLLVTKNSPIEQPMRKSVFSSTQKFRQRTGRKWEFLDQLLAEKVSANG